MANEIKLEELEPVGVEKRESFSKAERENIIADIWRSDLLGNRQAEAEEFERFLKNRFERRTKNREQDAFTVAVDQHYGAGKSWFSSAAKRPTRIGASNRIY